VEVRRLVSEKHLMVMCIQETKMPALTDQVIKIV